MKTKSSINSVPEIVQDFLVPELKAVKVSIDSIQNEMRLRDENQSRAMQHLDEKLTQTTQHLSEKIQALSDKVDTSAEFRERLASPEARMPAK
jgi:DNA-binding transcriptional MerR regulator